MTVEVRYFASLAESTGCSRETVDVDDQADVESLWRALVKRHPSLSGVGFRPLVACDRTYSAWDHSLAGVREVAFLPPVSGG